jgi:hypothetical protein
MSESFAKQLSRFTPDSTGLDRDGLLFAAGRASARPHRGWLALCSALAASQLLTVTLLWPRPAVSPLPSGDAPAVVKSQPPAPGSNTPSLWDEAARVSAAEGGLPPAVAVDHLVAPDPPLHAFGPPPAGLLD